MRKFPGLILLLLLTFSLLACGDGTPDQTTAPSESASGPTLEPIAESTSAPGTSPTTAFTTTDEPPPATIVPVDPASTAASAPSTLPGPVAGAISYNLPTTTLTSPIGLYVSPNRADLVVQGIEIPAGQTVYIMGRNATGSHLRAVWNAGVGWVPVSVTDYNGATDKLASLPIFEQEPPGCAEPITTQFNLNSNWTSDRRQRLAVVVDLFRSRYGDFPPSYLSLMVNGQEQESSRRPIVERGQFSLKDIVFTLSNYLQEGDTVGYLLDTTSDEPLAFMATLFRIPEGCVWDID